MKHWVCCALAAACIPLTLASCGPTPRPPEPDNLFWPLPPDQPRIKYIQSVYTEDDIGRAYSFMEKLFGKEYDDALHRPYGVFARSNQMIVTDILSRKVLLFDRGQRRLSFAGTEGTLQTPSAAVTDAAGNLYVADAGSDRIAVYDAMGTYQTAFIIQNSKPVALALNDSLGRLYVVDRKGHRVVVLGLDGKERLTFGGPGTDDGRFNIPLSIALDRNGGVYVLDNGNFRVQHFTPEGKFISKFGSVGDRAGQFANPKGIAVNSEGHIYVTDAAFGNFQIFDRNGAVLLSVGGLGSAPGLFHLPAGIAVDENDRIYVADQLNGRIQVFQYLRSP